MSCCFQKLSAIRRWCQLTLVILCFCFLLLFFFSPGDLVIQALVVSAAMNLHSVAALCIIIYTSVSLYFSFCILFPLILA